MSGYRLELNEEQLKRLSELLMVAAHVDGEYDGDEAEAIGDVLHELVRDVQLPDAVSAHLARFKVETFDLEAACASLRFEEPAKRRVLLALISHVLDADGLLSQQESEFIRKVGQTIGAKPEEYRDLTLDLTIVVPPPMPR